MIAVSGDPMRTNCYVMVHNGMLGFPTTKGIELELGTVPVKGFSGYVSASYTKSTIEDNTIGRLLTVNSITPTTPTGTTCTTASATCVLTPYPIAGSQFPDTPKYMSALSLQWADGPYLLNAAAKYTGKRALTLANDVVIPGYTTVDFNAAWKLPNPSGTGFKNPIIRLNVSNVFSKKYYLANAGSGSNVTADASGSPQVYSGAPRFTSVTFQVDY